MDNNNMDLQEKSADKDDKLLNSHPLLGSIISATVSTVIGGLLVSFLITTFSLPNKFSYIEKNTDILLSKVTEIDNINARLQTLESDIKNLKDDTDKLDNRLYEINKFTPTANTINSLELSYNDSDIAVLPSPTWNSKDVIVTDLETKTDITAEELVNKTLLLPYMDMENEQEVYFLGQFNENNHWDGHCIINIYENDYLIFIMDAVYDDGTIQFYKQMLPYEVEDTGDYVWSVSHRSYNGKSNIGESWVYHEDKDLYSKKIFNFDNVTYMDMITADQFKKSITTPLESYYHGNTSKGNYNDTTGESYIVRFYKDGNVRLLYYGDFVDSAFIDDDAWEIYYSSDDNSYVYCKGIFEDDEYKGEDKTLVSVDEINNLIKGYNFDCELKWKEN